MASVDYSYRLRYFDKVGDRYAIKKAVKELVHIDFHNLKTEYDLVARGGVHWVVWRMAHVGEWP